MCFRFLNACRAFTVDSQPKVHTVLTGPSNQARFSTTIVTSQLTQCFLLRILKSGCFGRQHLRTKPAAEARRTMLIPLGFLLTKLMNSVARSPDAAPRLLFSITDFQILI